MAHYKARYKTDADPEWREWSLGQHRSRDEALEIFNNVARQERLGVFSFDNTNPVVPHYNLVEQEVLSDPEVIFPLYTARPPK